MKAAFELIPIDNEQSSFTYYWNIQPAFHFHWHYHPEFELTYIHKGKGSRLVGDAVSEFEDGDLVLLGSNLPHTWVSESVGGEKAKAVVVQFPETILPLMPEYQNILDLLKRAKRGLYFFGSSAKKASGQLIAMEQLSGLKKLNRLWLVLDDLAKAKEYQALTSSIYAPTLGKENEYRIDQACQYIHQHFTSPIYLSQMAALTHLTETSFCRFFRKMTGRTLTDYVNELRIGKACKLLAEHNRDMPEIAFCSGFNSMTHFNRTFLKRKGMSPLKYRKQFRQST